MNRCAMITIAITIGLLLAGCQQQVSVEKHHSIHLSQEISTSQAFKEAATMDKTLDRIDSGPLELHRETIIEKSGPEEVVIE